MMVTEISTCDPDELLDLHEVAAILKTDRAVVQKWCRAKRLPAKKIGKEYRIRRSDLDAWYAALP